MDTAFKRFHVFVIISTWDAFHSYLFPPSHCDSSGALNHSIYSSPRHCILILSFLHVSYCCQMLAYLCIFILVSWLSPLQDVSSMTAGTFLSYSPLYFQHLNLSWMRDKLSYEEDKILTNLGLIAYRIFGNIFFHSLRCGFQNSNF